MAEQGFHDVITVVLTADNHLGYDAFGQHASVGVRFTHAQERLRRLRSALKQATDFAVGQGVDLFIQAGDLFDTPHPAERDRSFVAARLAELRQAGIRAFAVSGLHDGISYEDDIAPQVSYAHLGALHYFPPLPSPSRRHEHAGASVGASLYSRPEMEPVMVDVRGNVLAVYGMSVPAGYEGDPLLRSSASIERAPLSLLIVHAPIEGLPLSPVGAVLAPHQSQFQPQAQENAGAFPGIARATLAAQSSFRLIVAGGHHAYRHERIGQADVIVAGATQQIDFGDPESEPGPGFVFLGLAADGVRWCHHIPVDSLRLRRLVISTSELWGASGRGPTETILERLRPLCTDESMVQLQLVGELNRGQYHQLDLSQVRRYGEEHCFELAIDESGLSLVSHSGFGISAVNGRGGGEGERSFAGLRMTESAFGMTENALKVTKDAMRARPESVSRSNVVLSEANRSPESSEGEGEGMASLLLGEVEERLSPREELVSVADEWIAGASDDQEKKALIATKEELLTALERMKRR